MRQKIVGEKSEMKKLQMVVLAAAIVAFIVLVFGGVIRAAGGSSNCPDWPTCYGSWLPPREASPFMDYAHRFATLLLAPLLVGSAVYTKRVLSKDRRVSLLLWSAVGLFAIQVGLGALVILTPTLIDRRALTGLHLGLSLVVLANVVASAVILMHKQAGTDQKAFTFRSPFARLTLWNLAFTFLLLISGVVVSSTGASDACRSWPLCEGGLIPGSPAAWINLLHRFIVLANGLLMGIQLIQAWKTQRSRTAVLAAATASTVMFFSLSLMGAVEAAQGFPAYFLGLHEATAVAVWGALIVQVVSVGLSGTTAEAEAAEAAAFAAREGGLKAMARDLFMLTKPVVVALLLVTTYAGMVIGARAWPNFWIAVWTMLGGFMAAGGSGAINQYIDRDDDRKMQRTQRRPLPSGRLTPGEGLAFGIALTLGSFFLMIALVNLLAALLSLAGIIYYVLLYSILLKKTTHQNIVIGGGAGAIPPLVGWAAATGSLNFPALLLFAVIFMWTPPHFWALAIVRAKDYARAGVPMLPVVRGDREARSQILIYTIELVALTLFLPIFGLGGSIYLVSAIVLGGLLLYSAWNLWSRGGNKVAWKMYRHSSMYLALLFVALMIDRLV